MCVVCSERVVRERGDEAGGGGGVCDVCVWCVVREW